MTWFLFITFMAGATPERYQPLSIYAGKSEEECVIKRAAYLKAYPNIEAARCAPIPPAFKLE